MRCLCPLPMSGEVPTTSRVSTTGTLPEFVSNPSPAIYRYGNFVCLDFETTNRSKGSALDKSNRIVLARWSYNNSQCRPVGDDWLEKLFEDLDNADFLLAHNAKFELQWLRRLGYTRDMVVYDTMLGEYVWAGNRKVPLGLDDLCLKYLGAYEPDPCSIQMIEGEVCPSTMNQVALGNYCEGDVWMTVEVFKLQIETLDELNLLPVVYTRCLLTPCLADIESRGMALDRDAVRSTYTQYNEDLNALKGKLDVLTGGVNLNSPKQLGVYLYDTLGFAELVGRDGSPDRTDAGGRRTDADTLLGLKRTSEAQHRFADLFQDYGSLKVNTKALEKMWLCCKDTPSDEVPILYASYNQAVTVTHRLSSSGSKYKLQFQNFNRDFKPLFTFRERGWYVGEADASQLEFRVAAHLGRDVVASKDIRDPGFDVHFQTAETILRRPRAKISGEERNLVKPKTFRPLYGGMAGTKDERAYYKFFQDKYGGIYSTQTGWTHTVARAKKLVTETGLIFYWPDCKVQPDGYVTHRTNIFNFPVQNLATADIIPIALVCAWYRLRSLGCRSFLTNTVHDSIIGEVAPDEVDTFTRVANVSLTSDCFDYLVRCYGIQFTVPLGAETKLGSNWGKGKGGKYDLDPVKYFAEVGTN